MRRSAIGAAIAGVALWIGLGGIATAQSEAASETGDEADIPTMSCPRAPKNGVTRS